MENTEIVASVAAFVMQRLSCSTHRKYIRASVFEGLTLHKEEKAHLKRFFGVLVEFESLFELFESTDHCTT